MIEHELLDLNIKIGQPFMAIMRIFRHDTPSKDRSEFEQARFVVDTGASTTHISRKLLSDLGYTDFSKDTTKSKNTTQVYYADVCHVRKISFGGLSIGNHKVKIFEKDEGSQIDGLIGMDILKYFNINIDHDAMKATFKHS